MDYGIHSEDRPGGVRALTVANPKRRNALDDALLGQLIAALERPREDGAKVRALLVRGAGDAFCSGYDLSSLGPPAPDGPLPDETLQRALGVLEAQDAPVVALVEGPAYGAGCDLACACDLRVGGPRAAFAMPPARLGVVYAPEGMERVMSLVGPSRARRMFLCGEPLDAEGALQAGLLDELRPEAEAASAAEALCAALAAGAPLAVAGMKRGFRWLSRPSRSAGERAELEQLRRAAFLSADAREGRDAFLEKRAPRFEGR